MRGKKTNKKKRKEKERTLVEVANLLTDWKTNYLTMIKILYLELLPDYISTLYFAILK